MADRAIYIIGSLLLISALVGSMFAQIGTSTNIQVDAIAAAGIAVTDATSDPSWGPLSKGMVGKVAPGDIYIVNPDNDLKGFITLTLVLVNAGDLAKNVYKYLILKIKICKDPDGDADEPAVDSNGNCNTTNGWQDATEADPQVFILTLKNANIEFLIDHTAVTRPDKYSISVSMGSFMVNKPQSAGTVNHEFFLAVEVTS